MNFQNSSAPVSTSLEPELHQQQRQLYSQILGLLSSHRVPHAVAGAFALQQHTGIWRVTKDLDIFLTAKTLPKALALLRTRDFECEVCDPVWLAKVHRGEFFIDFITGMSNGTIIVTDSWIDRAMPAKVAGIETRILRAEELLASKLFVARRERFDGADIAHIIYATRENLDWNRILELTGAHWEILLWALLLYRYVYPAQSHYVPRSVWTDLTTRLTSSLSSSDPSAPFRGSLIDDNMFAIDVNEWGLDNLLAESRSRRLKEIDAYSTDEDAA
jgi:hypothetical protein